MMTISESIVNALYVRLMLLYESVTG